MARPGITYQEVARAATQLLAQQTRPSIEAVRKILGTGSNSTINRHLREWSKTQGMQAELEQGLPDSLLIAVRGVYDAMREDANSRVVSMQSEHQQAIHKSKSRAEELTKSYAQAEQDRANLQNMLRQTQEECSALQRLINTLKQENNSKQTENHLLNERLNDKQAEIKQINQLLQHSQSNLDHYRETMRQERTADKHKFEQKIASMESKHQQQQEILAELREKVARLTQYTETLENDRTAAISSKNEALKKCQCHEGDLRKMGNALKTLQFAHDELSQTHSTMVEQSKVDKQKIHDLTLNTEKNKEKINMYKIALQKAEDSLKNLSDKHLFLTQEKTELAVQLKQVLAAT